MLGCIPRSAVEHGSTLQSAATGSGHSPAALPHAARRGRLLRRRSGNSPCPACPARTGRRCSRVAQAQQLRHAMHDLLGAHLPTDPEVIAARPERGMDLAPTDQARRHARCADAVTAIDAARWQPSNSGAVAGGSSDAGAMASVGAAGAGRGAVDAAGRAADAEGSAGCGCTAAGCSCGNQRNEILAASSLGSVILPLPSSHTAIHPCTSSTISHATMRGSFGESDHDSATAVIGKASMQGPVAQPSGRPEKFRWHRCRLKPSSRAAASPWQNRAIRRYPCCRCRRSPLPHRP